jgi:hypothetical protein
MSAILLFLAGLALIGFPLARSLDRSLAGESLVGTSFLCGSGLLAYALLLLSLVGIPWSRSALLVVLAVALATAFTAARRRGTAPAAALPHSWTALVVDLVILGLVVGHAIYATAAPIPEWDFWAIWGLKGKVFLIEGGIDWNFLRDPDNVPMHPDYPVLLPLLLAGYGLVTGGWEDQWAGILFTAFGVAVLLVARRCLREEQLTPFFASLATLGLTGCALSGWVGMAEAPLIAFSGAGLLLIRRGLLREQASSIRAGSLLLGLAAATKNEGLAFVVAAAIAVAVSSARPRRDLVRLWPALVVALPWLLIRAVLRLETVLFSGSLMDRAGERITHIGDFVGALGEAYVGRPLFWIGVLGAMTLLALSGRLRHERFLLTACLLQLGFYLGSYLLTFYDVAWHVAESWPRLLDQLSLPLGYIAFANLFLLVQDFPKERSHEREAIADISTG